MCVRRVADAIAELDVAQSLAQVAREGDYVRPEFDDSLRIEIEGGRHPVVVISRDGSGRTGRCVERKDQTCTVSMSRREGSHEGSSRPQRRSRFSGGTVPTG